MIAIEKNGERYHHPIITKKKAYQNQLVKQNSLASYGYKVFRWSLEGMRFKENFSEEMRRYFGNETDFLLSQKLSISRKVSLLTHQVDALQSINNQRNQGEKNFLIVLPTGTGKTEIMIADIIAMLHKDLTCKVLILVPSRQLKIDTIIKITTRIESEKFSRFFQIGENLSSDILVQTYAWISRYYSNFKASHFNYVAVDEAHHAVAPTLQKVIQHFNPDTLLGLTATDKRLDEKKLESIFGKYETDLSLVDAIKENLLAPIKAFRVKSNIDLSEIRFNGKDYMVGDLQKNVVVPSRDQLVVDVIKKYFIGNDIGFKSGLIFCVSVDHAKQMSKRMQEQGISAQSVSGNDNNSLKYITQYQNGEIQFLTTCSLLNEGWDSPRTSIIVMARPTMSKVLYTQQLGRGTRKYHDKEALYVIDVVDNYGGAGSFKNNPWSIHALLGISDYKAFSNLLESDRTHYTREELLLAGLYEEERKLEKIDIFTFEQEYADYLSDEQLARELFISTGTLRSWVKTKKVTPSLTIPLGRQKINYYAPEQLNEICTRLNLKVHDDTTQYEDFYDFLNEGNYSMSYKMIMMLSMLKIIDHNGECPLDILTQEYRHFYQKRRDDNLSVDRKNCPYSESSFLEDDAALQRSILQNPFEKFERKRFMYHSKDLNHIAFSNHLWQKISKPQELKKIRELFFEDLITYYQQISPIENHDYWKKYWGLV
jgi:superfamily II DNA or RNA helicase